MTGDGLARLLAALVACGCKLRQTGPDRWQALCPCHDDRKASLTVSQGDAKAVFHCHAGCDPDLILRTLGLTWAELRDDWKGAESAPRLPVPRGSARHTHRPAPVTEQALRRLQANLLAHPDVLEELRRLRGWTREAIEQLGLGLDDRGLIVFPVRDAAGVLSSTPRYQPDPSKRNGQPKLRAPAGSKRDLFPAPEMLEVPADALVALGEGESDTVALHSIGLSAIGVPGVGGWRSEWASRFVGRRVLVVFDADASGRQGAERIARDLGAHAREVVVVDLAPDRDDGFDVTDFIRSVGSAEVAREWLLGLAERGSPRPLPRNLLDELARFMRRFVVMSAEQADVIALWIAHTHFIDAAEATPYLHVRSAEKRSGKSRLLEILELLVRHPLPAANISDAALFRTIEERTPTLLLDEVDAIFGSRAREREDLRGLLNAGYRRGAAVYRMGGPKMTTLETFAVFCPKAFAGIGDGLPDTIVDRAVPITLQRRTRDEPVERFRRRDVTPQAAPLKRAAEEWANQECDRLAEARPELPDELDDRAQDVWEPLLALADNSGGDWPARARRAAVALSGAGGREDDSLTARLLADIYSVFETAPVHRLKTADLIDGLSRIEESPWGDWHGKAISAQALSKLLKPFRIKTMPVWVDGQPVRGYKREQFAEAWLRVVGVRSVRSVRSQATGQAAPNVPDAPNAPSALPALGEEGYRAFINIRAAQGRVTAAEQHDLRLLHCLAFRHCRPVADEAKTLRDLREFEATTSGVDLRDAQL